MDNFTTTSATHSTQDDDIRLLVEIAILSIREGVDEDFTPIGTVWEAKHPNDALGPVFRGLAMVRAGQIKEGIDLVESTANAAETRSDQASYVVNVLRTHLGKFIN